jgi:heme-degrading monooxygenase HmoA
LNSYEATRSGWHCFAEASPRSGWIISPQKGVVYPVIAAIIEVWPETQRKREYLDAGARLRPMLDGMDGFLSIERFASIYEPGKILSLSFWRDDEAAAKWRQMEAHRTAQATGGAGAFRNFRIRIADVFRDHGFSDRDEAPEDSRQFHE